jgi:hypothetical protein
MIQNHEANRRRRGLAKRTLRERERSWRAFHKAEEFWKRVARELSDSEREVRV